MTLGTPPAREATGRFVAEGVERSGGAALLAAGPDYFAVLGIKLLAGRAFTAEDRRGSMPVAIVDDKAAELFWPGETALGKRVRYSPYVEWMTVVGVARRVKTSDLGRASNRIQMYLPVRRQGSADRPSWHARSINVAAAFDARRLARAFSSARQAPVSTAAKVEDLYDPALVNPRFSALMMSLFAGLGLLTAAVGLYGMLSYAVAQRTREIGVRMALGADRRAVRRLIVNDALWPVMSGLALGRSRRSGSRGSSRRSCTESRRAIRRRSRWCSCCSPLSR